MPCTFGFVFLFPDLFWRAVTVFCFTGPLSIKLGMVLDKTNTQVKQHRHKSNSSGTNYFPFSHHTDVKVFVLSTPWYSVFSDSRPMQK
jgi:hypothetical protein